MQPKLTRTCVTGGSDFNMAEEKVDHSCTTDSTKQSSEDENTKSGSPAPEYNHDLRSVLVTSVLNVEKLDVDLYR